MNVKELAKSVFKCNQIQERLLPNKMTFEKTILTIPNGYEKEDVYVYGYTKKEGFKNLDIVGFITDNDTKIGESVPQGYEAIVVLREGRRQTEMFTQYKRLTIYTQKYD